jgi:hypothetical protein
MQNNPESPKEVTSTQIRVIRNFNVLAARLMWFLLGPAGLLFIVLGIVLNGKGWFFGLDLLLVAVVGFMILGRWVELRSGVATTVEGEPATIQHFKSYVPKLLLVVLGAWLCAKLVANYVLA